MKILDILKQEFMENTIGGYLWFVICILAALALKRVIANILINLSIKLLSRHLSSINPEQFKKKLVKPLSFLILVSSIYLAVQYIDFPASWELADSKHFGIRKVIVVLYGLMFGISLTWILIRLADCIGIILEKNYRPQDEKSTALQVIPFATDFIKIVIGVVAGLIILSTLFGINVGTLVAGLGIGGLAVALAAKDTFENLLGSFVIYLDKPFEIGDYIRINEIYCTVEKIGLRSTRLRTLEKSLLTMPNKMLVESMIDNYTLRPFRRVDRIIALSRDTMHEQMITIIAGLKKAIGEHPLTTDEIYFNFHEITSFSLEIRIQYYVMTAEWEIYLKAVGEINLIILKIIEDNGSSLANVQGFLAFRNKATD